MLPDILKIKLLISGMNNILAFIFSNFSSNYVLMF